MPWWARLKADINRLCPLASPGPGDAVEPEAPVTVPDRAACFVRATESGYLQNVDRDGLVAAADRSDLLIKALRRPGDFVSCGDALLQVWSQQDGFGEDQARRLREAFTLGARRTPT